MFNFKAFDLYYGWCIKFAGKVDDFKKKHPELSNEIDEFVSSDPSSGKNKYLEWMVKQLKAGFKKEDIIPTVKLFHKVIDKLDKKDINQYGTVKDLEDKLKEIDSKSVKEKRQVAKENGKKLYEDENYVLIRPDDKNACMTYGKGTKWCITMENASYYEQYKMSNVVFYFLIKKHPEGDELDKIAFAYARDNSNKNIGWEIYDAEDKLIHMNGVWLDEPYTNGGLKDKIINIIKSDAPTVPKSVLAKLSSGEASESELEELMKSPDAEVRSMVAKKAPEDKLIKMVNDPDYDVQANIIERAPEDVLKLMMKSEFEDIRASIIGILKSEKEIYKYKDDPSPLVRREVLKRTEPNFVSYFLKDKDEVTRNMAVERLDASEWDRLVNLANDPSSYVRESVVERLPRKFMHKMVNEPISYIRQHVIDKIDPAYLLEMFQNETDPNLKNRINNRLNYLTRPEKKASDKNRAKMDVRNDQPLRKNYDYGEGLYSGDMSKYKSVSDFLKAKRKKRKKILNAMLERKL